MALCMLLILAGPAVSIAHADFAVIGLIAAMAAGIAAFMANYFSFTQEVSARHTGLIAGYLGGLGNLAVAAYVPFAGALAGPDRELCRELLDRGTGAAHRNRRAVFGVGASGTMTPMPASIGRRGRLTPSGRCRSVVGRSGFTSSHHFLLREAESAGSIPIRVAIETAQPVQ